MSKITKLLYQAKKGVSNDTFTYLSGGLLSAVK